MRITDYYEVVEMLHASSNSGTEVHLARHRLTGEMVVMKALDRTRLNRGMICTAAGYHARIAHHEHVARFLSLYDVAEMGRVILVLERVPVSHATHVSEIAF